LARSPTFPTGAVILVSEGGEILILFGTML
jgi:hypothetical protein